MDTDALPEPIPQAKPTTERLLEVISKSLAAVAILVYASGFLITSIYHSSYGFIESDPLRPRILFAGAWFMLFSSVPVLLTWRFMTQEYWASKKTVLEKIHDLLFDYYTTIGGIGFSVLIGVFEFDNDNPGLATHEPYSRTRIMLVVFTAIGAIIGFLALAAIMSHFLMKYLPKLWRTRLWVGFLLVSASFVLIPAYRDISQRHKFSSSALLLWFAVTGIAVVAVSRITSGRRKADFIPLYSAVVLPAITTFATIYYPHIKSSWGGGMTVPAVMTLTKDSPVLPLQNVSVAIIDESSLGFYVVSQNDTKATFIPRSSVGLIHFDSEPSVQFSLKTQ